VVEEPMATTLLLPGQRLVVDELGNLLIRTGRSAHGDGRAR
jgi:hypothetical protein